MTGDSIQEALPVAEQSYLQMIQVAVEPYTMYIVAILIGAVLSNLATQAIKMASKAFGSGMTNAQAAVISWIVAYGMTVGTWYFLVALDEIRVRVQHFGWFWGIASIPISIGTYMGIMWALKRWAPKVALAFSGQKPPPT